MIRVQNLGIRAGSFEINNLNFSIPTGSYTVLMGKTGTGKTTILEALCGLRKITAGRILMLDRDVTRLKPGERGIGLVPQDRALFPTLSVRENLSFALLLRKWTRAAIEQRVEELAELLGLRELLNRKPDGLSGGEAQRVALGRALASEPPVLCLDEPLSALDDETRQEMHALLRSVREHTRVTTLHVTHHLSDAEQLADTILLLRHGRTEPVSLDQLKDLRNASPPHPGPLPAGEGESSPAGCG